jgi:hypothetical protein
LILKDAILVVWPGKGRKWPPGKRKAGASSRAPNAVFYKVNYTRGLGKIKENLDSGEKKAICLRLSRLRTKAKS